MTHLQLKVYHVERSQNAADYLTKQSNTSIFRRLWHLAKPPFTWTHLRINQSKGGQVTERDKPETADTHADISDDTQKTQTRRYSEVVNIVSKNPSLLRRVKSRTNY